MAYSSEERRRLLQVTLPQSDEVRAKLQEYLNRTGLTAPDFGKRIGYSGISVKFFLEGRYEHIASNDTRLRGAISEFIESHPVGDLQTGPKGKVYETANLAAWRKIFYECLDKQRAAVVYGPPGIQKTFPVDGLIAELNSSEMVKGHKRRAYRVYCPEHCSPARIMKRIALACGTSPSGESDRILRNLRFEFSACKVLIVFDEAQHLDVRCLEAVRELLDELGWGVIFAGSHDLILTFKKSIELEQWNSRLRHAVELPGMTDEDARSIVIGELGNIGEAQISKLIAKARTPDPRRKVHYVSARRLFSGLTAIKENAERRRLQ